MKLHEYQQRAVDFMAAHPRCILSVGMGLFGMGFCCVACVFYAVLFTIAAKKEREQ